MKKILTIIIILLILFETGCTSNKANMSGYKRLTESHIYEEIDVKGMEEKMENGDTFVVYLGFEDCPWCKEAVPVLNKVAKEEGIETIYYINTRKDSTWESNLDLKDYDSLVDMVGDYLEYDENGVKHLYVPFVVFVKNGEVMTTHQGTVETHNPEERAELTQEETSLLEEIYRDGINAINN